MQPVTTVDITIIILPGIIIGAAFGYALGEMSSLRIIERIVISVVASLILGIVLSLIFNYLLPITTFSVFLAVISVLGGLVFGLSSNWNPPPELSRKSHIIYEPYDDEDFEREIEESLGGKK